MSHSIAKVCSHTVLYWPPERICVTALAMDGFSATHNTFMSLISIVETLLSSLNQKRRCVSTLGVPPQPDSRKQMLVVDGAPVIVKLIASWVITTLKVCRKRGRGWRAQSGDTKENWELHGHQSRVASRYAFPSRAERSRFDRDQWQQYVALTWMFPQSVFMPAHLCWSIGKPRLDKCQLMIFWPARSHSRGAIDKI